MIFLSFFVVFVCSHLSRLEVVFDAVLEAFPFGLEGSHDQTVANKVRRVADSFTGAEAAKWAQSSFSLHDANKLNY